MPLSKVCFQEVAVTDAGTLPVGRGHLSLSGEPKALTRCPQKQFALPSLHFLVWGTEAHGKPRTGLPGPPKTSTGTGWLV